MIKKYGIDGVYVVHALKGYEIHEKRLREIFNEMNIEFEFMTEGDPSKFYDEMLNRYFCPEVLKTLPAGVISCTLNHILCYERVISRQNKLP